MVKQILLPFDGSHASYSAFDAVLGLARRCKAEFNVVCSRPLPEVADRVEAQVDPRRESQEGLLRGLNLRGARHAVQPSTELLAGQASDQILRYAESVAADLIVLGHCDRGPLERWRPGLVTHRIISYAKCAVLVVR